MVLANPTYERCSVHAESGAIGHRNCSHCRTAPTVETQVLFLNTRTGRSDLPFHGKAIQYILWSYCQEQDVMYYYSASVNSAYHLFNTICSCQCCTKSCRGTLLTQGCRASLTSAWWYV